MTPSEGSTKDYTYTRIFTLQRNLLLFFMNLGDTLFHQGQWDFKPQVQANTLNTASMVQVDVFMMHLHDLYELQGDD